MDPFANNVQSALSGFGRINAPRPSSDEDYSGGSGVVPVGRYAGRNNEVMGVYPGAMRMAGGGTPNYGPSFRAPLMTNYGGYNAMSQPPSVRPMATASPGAMVQSPNPYPTPTARRATAPPIAGNPVGVNLTPNPNLTPGQRNINANGIRASAFLSPSESTMTSGVPMQDVGGGLAADGKPVMVTDSGGTHPRYELRPEFVRAGQETAAAQSAIRGGQADNVDQYKAQLAAPGMAQKAQDAAIANSPAAIQDKKNKGALDVANTQNDAKAKLSAAQIDAHLKALGLEGDNKIAVQKIIGNTQQSVADTTAQGRVQAAGAKPTKAGPDNKGAQAIYTDVYKHALATPGATPETAHAAAMQAVKGIQSLNGPPTQEGTRPASGGTAVAAPQQTFGRVGDKLGTPTGGTQDGASNPTPSKTTTFATGDDRQRFNDVSDGGAPGQYHAQAMSDTALNPDGTKTYAGARYQLSNYEPDPKNPGQTHRVWRKQEIN